MELERRSSKVKKTVSVRAEECLHGRTCLEIGDGKVNFTENICLQRRSPRRISYFEKTP